MQFNIAAYIAGENISESHFLSSLKTIAQNNISFKIYLITEVELFVNESNVVVENIGSKNHLLKSYWFKYNLPKFLKKENHNCFLSNKKLLVNCNIPQYFYLENNEDLFGKNIEKQLAIASKVIVTEPYFKTQLKSKFPTLKTENIFYGFKQKKNSLSFSQIKSIQGEFTNGYDYFLFFVDKSSSNFSITVLKAFSILKKWQKSSIKLLFLLTDIDEDNLIPDFKNYKYKDDIVFVQQTSKLRPEIISSAFACIYFSNYANNSFVVEALQNNIPTIVADNELNNNIFGDAVLYTSINEKNISDNMQQLYKDEQLKNELNYAANILLKNYDSDTSALQLCKIISST